MHYLGLVFVSEVTEEAVAQAMAEHKDDEWDWYRCGGRYDGWLLGEEEMKRRETHDGFNFDDANDSPARNSCRVSDLPAGKLPYFFVVGYDWIPQQYWNPYERSKHHDGFGAILDTPCFEERWQTALRECADKFVVVVDAHN